MECAESSQCMGTRKFYELPEEYCTRPSQASVELEKKQSLLQHINENIPSNIATFKGPFGCRQVIYCDYTASGQPLHFIENFLKSEVLPFYGNTHTTTSVSSLQSTLFRHEARDIIRNAVKAGEHDAVLFCGSGCTGAVHKLIHCMNLKNSDVIVFVGPFEHHSNLLPWREIGAKVIRIKERSDGLLDLESLEGELKQYSNGNFKLIGSFSAASNITGILTDDKSVTALLHKYGALAFWDYAAAGPYVDINMNPVVTGSDQDLVYKDAIFLSPHKFIGGPETPGILVAKKNLFKNNVPSECGGGTVFFVTQTSHRYLKEIEMREEGGTPSIIGAIRAGMVFQLKQAVGAEFILKREKLICQRAFNVWTSVHNLEILGNTSVDRLPIFSFLIRHPASGLYLHHNFVCALLNDLFGIQSRGGCACSGPYALDLLGIDEQLAKHFDELLLEDSALDRVHLRRYREYSAREVLRPGFCRLSLPYFVSDDDIDFVIKAVAMVANDGWKFLPQYIFNPETGEWKHRTHKIFHDRKWLGSVSYKNGCFSYTKNSDTESCPPSQAECIAGAEELFEKASEICPRNPLPDQDLIFDDEALKVRWFLLPSEAQKYLFHDKISATHVTPFCIRQSSCAKHVNKVTETRYPGEKRCMKSKHGESQCCTVLSPQSVLGMQTDCLLAALNSVSNKNSITESHDLVERDVCAPKIISQWHSPPAKLFHSFLKAVTDFRMINDGDRVLVCLSGGKDSLSLLHTLHQYQFYAKKENVHFDLGAVTVDPKSTSYDPSPLKPYLASLKIPYFYEEQAILEQASRLKRCKSICSFCSRIKRGRIYACAQREKYNVIALGQHLDDLTESFIMSVFHNGRLRTMKACYVDESQMFRIIRPFVFVREKELRKFAEEKRLPIIAENCPACFEAPKERHRIKQLLASQEILFPRLYESFRSAMFPLMAINRTGIEGQIAKSFFNHNASHTIDTTDCLENCTEEFNGFSY